MGRPFSIRREREFIYLAGTKDDDDDDDSSSPRKIKMIINAL